MNALSSLRVIELGTGPTVSLTCMILADFGAEVLRIEPPRPGPLDRLPAAPMWKRGKCATKLDLNKQDDLKTLLELLGSADMLVTNWRSSKLKARGLDFEQLSQTHPHLNVCHITGFGLHGPLSDLPAYEHVVAAYTGRMLQFAGLRDRAGPVWSAVQVATHIATQSAVTGILAACFQQSAGERGRYIETSLMKGLLPYDMGGLIALQHPQEFVGFLPFLDRNDNPPKPSLYYHPAQAGDGQWMQFGNLLPHLFDSFLIATDLIDVLADPLYDPAQMLLTEEDAHEAFRQRMLGRIQSQSSATWMQTLIDDGGIVGTTYQSTQAAMDDPDLVDNGHVVSMGDDGLQIGPLARLSETPAYIRAPITDVEERLITWRQSPRSYSTAERAASPPLSGIRVIEIATIIAAPLGASMLADLGAEVIKIEPIAGDPFRSLMSGLGAMRVNAGKKSLCVNLKTSEGKRVVLDLIQDADIVIHNYRPGVPERLGIDYASVQSLNHELIYIQSNGYGPDGPGAHRPSTHPIPGAAMGGVFYQMGETLPSDLLDKDDLLLWTSRLMRANELNPDPNTSAVIATSALLGLSARKRTGQGQQIMVDMFGANAYANADDFVRYPGKEARSLPDAGLHGLSAGYRLYECLNNTWVFLALVTKTDRETFTNCLLEMNIRDITAADLDRNDDVTAEQLMRAFLIHSADDWMRLCVDKGVSCVRADHLTPAHFWSSPQNPHKVPALDASLGAYHRHAPLVEFDETPYHAGAAPLKGQHTREVLLELGRTQAEIDMLIERGAISAH